MKRAIGGMEGMMGGEGSIWPRERRGGIPSRTTQSRRSTKHTQEESALSDGTDYFTAILYCNLLQSAAPLAETGPPQPVGQVADDDRGPSCVDIAHNLREDFTGLYWWHRPIRRGQTPRRPGRPHAKESGSLLHTFWPLRLLVVHVEGRWAVPGGPGSWVAGCGTFAE